MIHPDFSLGFPWKKGTSDFIYSFRTVKPKLCFFPLGLTSYLPLLSYIYPLHYLLILNFPGTVLHSCLCSHCFVLIAFGTLHSTCPLRPTLNASILHEVFLNFSSPPKHSLLSTLQAWNVFLRELR